MKSTILVALLSLFGVSTPALSNCVKLTTIIDKQPCGPGSPYGESWTIDVWQESLDGNGNVTDRVLLCQTTMDCSGCSETSCPPELGGAIGWRVVPSMAGINSIWAPKTLPSCAMPATTDTLWIVEYRQPITNTLEGRVWQLGDMKVEVECHLNTISTCSSGIGYNIITRKKWAMTS